MEYNQVGFGVAPSQVAYFLKFPCLLLAITPFVTSDC